MDLGPRKVAYSVEVEAPAAAVFDLIDDPHRHAELDGSGTVRDNVAGPQRLTKGATFTTSMKMAGFPYRITSRVTAAEPDRLVEWRHPFGHRWRWEIEPLSDSRCRVTEIFDFSRGVAVGYRLLKFPARNAAGIAATLDKLRDRFAR